jgi:hypothetical protein
MATARSTMVAAMTGNIFDFERIFSLRRGKTAGPGD